MSVGDPPWRGLEFVVQQSSQANCVGDGGECVRVATCSARLCVVVGWTTGGVWNLPLLRNRMIRDSAGSEKSRPARSSNRESSIF